MAKEESLEFEGVVMEDLSNGNFRIETNEKLSMLGYLAGKMRKHNIRVIPGDKVKVEVSPYDLTRCRITYRVRA